MKKILYISAILLFIFAIFGKAQAKDGESGRDEWRMRTSTSGSFGDNQWSRGGDDGEDDEDESDDDSRIRTRLGTASVTSDDDSDDDDESDDSDDDNSVSTITGDDDGDDDNDGLRNGGENRFKLFPFLKGSKKEGALDMIQRQETATGSGTHSPFFKENKGESDNRNPRADFRNKIGMRFTFAMHNLDNLRTRLSTHINFLKTKGADVTTATTLLATADADIASAKTAVDALQAKIDAVMAPIVPTVTANVTDATTITPPTIDDATKAEIRALATTAKDAIVKAYQSLGAVIGELKTLHQQNKIDDEDTTPAAPVSTTTTTQ